MNKLPALLEENSIVEKLEEILEDVMQEVRGSRLPQLVHRHWLSLSAICSDARAATVLCVTCLFIGLMLLRKINLAASNRRRRARTWSGQRKRTDSRSFYGNRLRSVSSDFLGPTGHIRQNVQNLQAIFDDARRSLDSYDEGIGVYQQEHQNEHIIYYGPAVAAIRYETLTPPPTWGETSKHLLPKKVATLEREILLHISSSPLLSIHTVEDKIDSSEPDHEVHLPVSSIGTHVKLPASGGVLHLYVNESSEKIAWREHTFPSAQAAAQFQADTLALQLFGPEFFCIYQAFELCHRGSIAYEGQEFVLHDAAHDNNVHLTAPGIAWDDVMRCLGSSFPSIRHNLHQLWWSYMTATTIHQPSQSSLHIQGKKTETSTDLEKLLLSSEYHNKRLMLGPVDLFRLFVPFLPEDALPKSKSDARRMEQLLRWRKRLGRASLVVQTYSRARAVCNKGWQLSLALPDNYLKRRLSYDDNTDNLIRDLHAQNEYYEATVSRDVLNEVRNATCLERKAWWNFESVKPSLSLNQAYALVGVHVFQTRDNGPLQLANDPVEAISSLRSLIESHPDLDFFVTASYREVELTCTVCVYVRSLARGIDQSFDCVIDRYVNGDERLRQRKIEMLIQLGVDKQSMHIVSLIVVMFLSILRCFSVGTRPYIKQSASSLVERTSLPSMLLEEFGDMYHFGGALRSSASLPGNYVAESIRLDSRQRMSLSARMMLAYLRLGCGRNEVLDLTLVLTGDSAEEAPERALTTARFVNVNFPIIALPESYIHPHSSQGTQEVLERQHRAKTTASNFLKLYTEIFVIDPVLVTVQYIAQALKPAQVERVARKQNFQLGKAGIKTSAVTLVTADPFGQAVNELIEILGEVSVPKRVFTANMDISHALTEAPVFLLPDSLSRNPASDDFALTEVPVLQEISRKDIQRFFLATKCDIKKAAVRIVDSISWRGLTFPINTQRCLVELQNGQFFQQGRDKLGNAVFYFRHTLLGPWRKNEGAVIAAVLHRLETSLRRLTAENSDIQCTLIVVMGRPFKKKKRTVNKNSDETTAASSSDTPISEASDVASVDDNSDDDGETVDTAEYDAPSPITPVNNPRIQKGETWYSHTNKDLIKRLIKTVMYHYPERLYKALVVVRNGNKSYVRTAFGGMWTLSQIVKSSRTRQKIEFITEYVALRKHVAKEELVALVGGDAKILPTAFTV